MSSSSSMIRVSGRSTGQSCNKIVRRMVSLPRNIMNGVSRVMDQGMDFMGIGGRRTNNHPNPPPNYPYPNPFDFHFQDPYNVTNSQQHLGVQEEWAFLTSFEQQFGTEHPFFYACCFMDALKIAKDENKFLFVYFHSPQHPFTPGFCSESLCSELVVQFLDANYVCWGALADRGEGLHMATSLRASSFPFCALVAPAPGDSIAVLQQMEGPVSPAELVEILQRTMEEQGLAFGSGRAKEQEKIRADNRLREEQDVAYVASLQLDQEKERLKNVMPPLQRNSKPEHVANKSNQEKPKQDSAQTQASRKTSTKATTQNPTQSQSSKNKEPTNASAGKSTQMTRILIRFPNGERREQSFSSKDKVQAIFRYIDSLGLPEIGNYRLISNFPRKVYGVDQMGVKLKDAGLHPKASLFLEPL